MSTWQEDMYEGLRLLGLAIEKEVKAKVGGEAGGRAVAGEADETQPGQVRGLIRLVKVAQRRGVGAREVIYPGTRVKVFDELDRVTRSGEVIKLWCPYGYEMVGVRLEKDGGVDWFPAVDCIVVEGSV